MESIVSSRGEIDDRPLRPLGAFERLYHRFTQRYSLHHTTVAEMNDHVHPDALRSALLAMQVRHPLLLAKVVDSPTGPIFVRLHHTVEVPIRIVETAERRTWEDVNSEEMSKPFDPVLEPRVRVTLLHSDKHSTLILAVDHRVLDGMAATFLLSDIIAVLNGRVLPALPVPAPQEELLGALIAANNTPTSDGRIASATESAADIPDLPVLDPALMLPGVGGLPTVTSATLNSAVTADLIRTARTKGTTVHGAIVAAGVQALITARGLTEVRTLTPFDLRGIIGNGQDLVDHHAASLTVSPEADADDLWALAKLTTIALDSARSVPAVLEASAALQMYISSDVSIDTAANFLGMLAFDLAVSNVKVVDINSEYSLRPTAIWGPTLLCQIRGETMIGVTTYENVLRMVHVSHTPVDGFLDDVTERLIHATQS